MKALVLKEYNEFSYEEFPTPQIKPDEVLVSVKACGICGSDVHGMDGSTGRRIPPIVMGHEASGVISQVGDLVTDWQEGDRVTFDSTIYELDDWYTRNGLYNIGDNRMVLGVSCDEYRRHGAFAEYVAVPQHILYRLPEKVSFDQAAIVEPAAVALHAVELTPVSLNDTAVVVGAGMIGLFIIQALRAAGCGRIIALDLEQERLDLALKLGADIGLLSDRDDTVHEIKKMTSNRGADIALEAVGISETLNMAIESLRKGGTLTLVGNLAPQVTLPLQAVVTRQLRLQGSCAICGEYPAVLDMIERGTINVDAILSATAPLFDGAKWFQRLYNKDKGLMKVVLNP